MGPSDIAVHW